MVEYVDKIAAILAGPGGPAGDPDVVGYFNGLKKELVGRGRKLDPEKAEVAAHLCTEGGPGGILSFEEQIDNFFKVYDSLKI